jgi:hypothetical protein
MPPIALAIVALLAILSFSSRQVIDARVDRMFGPTVRVAAMIQR